MSRWRTASVRTRAVLAALIALIPVLAVATLAGVLIQRDDLTSSTVLLAREHAVAVARELDGGATAPAAIDAAGGEDLVQVVEDRRVVASSDGLGQAAPLAAASGGLRATSGLVAGEADRYAVVTAGSSTPGTYVVVARSLEVVDEATRSTTQLLVVGSLLVVAAVCALTWTLTGRALRPVEGMRRRAEQITAADLSARLPTPHTGDEIARLATTMNALLDRIEDSVNAQRQFVADASHELRSPVAAIRTLHETAHLTAPRRVTSAEALSADVLPADVLPADVLSTEVLGEVARLEVLVSDLLLLARDEQRTSMQIPVDLAAEATAIAGRPRRVPVVVDAPERVRVLGDPQALARMVRNLIDNAERHATSRIDVTVTEDTGGAHLVVADDGPGVPDHELERIFGRFVRLDGARARDAGGSGLGLAIVRQIAARHGGTARAVPSRDPDRLRGLGGAVFVITLPPSY